MYMYLYVQGDYLWSFTCTRASLLTYTRIQVVLHLHVHVHVHVYARVNVVLHVYVHLPVYTCPCWLILHCLEN